MVSNGFYPTTSIVLTLLIRFTGPNLALFATGRYYQFKRYLSISILPDQGVLIVGFASR